MKDNTSDERILTSAATHMKHSRRTQGDVYDVDSHLRCCEAAMQFCEEYARQPFEAPIEPEDAQQHEQQDANDQSLDFDQIDDEPIVPSWGDRAPAPPQRPTNSAPTVAPVPRRNATTSQQANVTFTDPSPQRPTTIIGGKRVAPEHEYIINIVTAGEIMRDSPRHQILWEESPHLLNWWGDLPEGFVFDSSRYVSREIQIQTGKSKKDIEIGIIGSIQPSLHSHAEITLACGSMVQLDLMTCEFKRLNADQATIVKWELTRPDTWLLELDKCPQIINDAGCDFKFSTESQKARLEWMAESGKLFPTAQEGIVVLEAARCTVDDVGGTCQLIEIVLEWFQSKESHLLPTAIDHLNELLVIYPKGSMLHDSANVLLTFCRHSA